MAGYDYYPPPATPPAAVALTHLTHAPHHNLPIMAATTQQPAAAAPVPLYEPHLHQQHQQNQGQPDSNFPPKTVLIGQIQLNLCNFFGFTLLASWHNLLSILINLEPVGKKDHQKPSYALYCV